MLYRLFFVLLKKEEEVVSRSCSSSVQIFLSKTLTYFLFLLLHHLSSVSPCFRMLSHHKWSLHFNINAFYVIASVFSCQVHLQSYLNNVEGHCKVNLVQNWKGNLYIPDQFIANRRWHFFSCWFEWLWLITNAKTPNSVSLNNRNLHKTNKKII